ncbi:hypothetical protein Tco_0483525 [Tanacetum coccineum]
MGLHCRKMCPSKSALSERWGSSPLARNDRMVPSSISLDGDVYFDCLESIRKNTVNCPGVGPGPSSGRGARVKSRVDDDPFVHGLIAVS